MLSCQLTSKKDLALIHVITYLVQYPLSEQIVVLRTCVKTRLAKFAIYCHSL